MAEPANQCGASTDDRAKQVRYAVVLNGGVSLAVWMGGVTHELNRIRLASEGRPSDQGERGSLQPWKDILAACQCRAVVDLVAGTSAGGLNGTLLATAVSRGADLPDMRDKWIELARLEKGHLVRRDPAEADSVLDGRYLEQQVHDTLAAIKPVEGYRRDCTLLVTATALDSSPVPMRLESGTEMCVRDGRRVYKFERRSASGRNAPGEAVQDDFAEDEERTTVLARAARASASFPVAFAPVWELTGLAAKRVIPTDDRVGESWLVDGGVLDNAPFEPLLKALRARPTDEPYERVMLYITPGVGDDEGSASKAVDTPKLPETLVSVMSAIREPDARLDVDSLKNVFTQMGYSRSQAHYAIYEFLKDPGAFDARALVQAARLVFPQYRKTRAEAFERQVVSAQDDSTSALLPPQEPQLDPSQVPGMPPESFCAPTGDSWNWGWPVADRILRWWGRALARLDAASHRQIRAQIMTAMEAIATGQREVAGFGDKLEPAPCSADDAETRMRRLRDLYDNDLNSQLGDVMSAASGAIATAFPEISAADLIEVSVGIEVLSGLLAWGSEDYDVPEFRFHNVTPRVKTWPLIPLESLAEQPSWPVKKLYGQRLRHFGAFVSADCRRRDWLWGRLDGASELSQQLLTAAGVDRDEGDELRENLVRDILRTEGVTPSEVVEYAKKVYTLPGSALLKRMVEEDHGQALSGLEDTVWALSRDFGTAGFWLRVVLAGEWSAQELKGKNFRDQAAARIVRPVSRIARGVLGRWLRKRFGLVAESGQDRAHAGPDEQPSAP